MLWFSSLALPRLAPMLYAADRMQPSPDQSTDRRVTVTEAAALLGITPDAVRSRLRRGTLQRDEAEDGTVLVVLDGDGPDASATDRPTDRPTVDYINALKEQIDRLDDQVSYMKAIISTRDEELRRKDHIIAALTERIPELEPAKESPPDAREGVVTDYDGAGEGDVHPKQEKRVSWWRRVFLGS
jgi:hypothetical protein